MLTLTPTFDGKRTIPSLEVTELMLLLLDLRPEDIVLEIGTGSGYQTKRFAETGACVHSIELEPWIDPTKTVGEFVFLYSGDGYRGLPEHAPFTAIAATCGIEEIPDNWVRQLVDGGRLVAPIGLPECQKLTLFRKENGELVPERIGGYVRFQMLRKPPEPGKLKYVGE
jgi:protein-L-isoaspartate(D-aspartate) O-methyltransferase